MVVGNGRYLSNQAHPQPKRVRIQCQEAHREISRRFGTAAAESEPRAAAIKFASQPFQKMLPLSERIATGGLKCASPRAAATSRRRPLPALIPSSSRSIAWRGGAKD